MLIFPVCGTKKCFTQVVLDPLNEIDFCPMLLLLLLAVAKDLEDFFKTAEETDPASCQKVLSWSAGST